MEPVDGEVPSAYPTILQQVDVYSGNLDNIMLVLLDGGINDVEVTKLIDPFNDYNISSLTRTHCYVDMKELLSKVTNKFKNAKIIVTGYYLIVNNDSDIGSVTKIIIAGGLLLGVVSARGSLGTVTIAKG